MLINYAHQQIIDNNNYDKARRENPDQGFLAKKERLSNCIFT